MSSALQPSNLDTVYFANSSFVVPANIKSVTLIAQGGGGGGGSGARQPISANISGGGGGAGGNYTERTFTVAELGGAGAVINVFVGQQAAGGSAILVDNTNGNPGTAGNNTSFQRNADLQTILMAAGGPNGLAGQAVATAGGGVANVIGQWLGGNGGNGLASVPGVAGVSANIAAGGGGGGGPAPSATIARDGGAGSLGGRTIYAFGVAVPAAGTAQSGNGNPGTALPANLIAAGGGGSGGGGSSTIVGGPHGVGGTGGNGALYGGGGGGGGATENGFNSGAGGFGAAGYARVIFS